MANVVEYLYYWFQFNKKGDDFQQSPNAASSGTSNAEQTEKVGKPEQTIKEAEPSVESNTPVVTKSIFDLLKEAEEKDREIERLKEAGLLPNTTILDLPDKVSFKIRIAFRKIYSNKIIIGYNVYVASLNWFTISLLVHFSF